MAVVFALACGVFWASTKVVAKPPAWLTFEFCQYAEIGKNLAEEGRFDTRLIEPMALAMIDREQRREATVPGRWPVVNRYPLPCFVIAGLMKLFGPTDLAAAWSNGLAISLLGAIGYAAAYRWFGGKWAAGFAVIFLANPAFFGEFILIGTPDVWFATVFLGELLLWSRFDPRGNASGPGLAWAVGLGVLGGLAYLTRFNATLMIGIQVLALIRWKRWRALAAMTITAAVVASPMAVYNVRHFGRPVVSIYSAWNLLDDIGAYRQEPWLYYQVPQLGVELAAHSDGVARKFATNLFRIIPTRSWNLWRLDVLLPLALVGSVFRGKATAEGRFAAWSTGLFLTQLVLFAGLRLELEPSVSPHHGRYFFWYAVPAVLIGLGLIRRVVARWKGTMVLAAPLLLGQLALFANDWRAIVPRHAEGTNLGHDPIRAMLAEVAAGRVVASNQPQMTAWFCGLQSISLPADPDELARMNRRSPTPADFVFIDVNYNCIDLDPTWARFAASDLAVRSPWEPILLGDYEYALPPRYTRPGFLFVLLRRKTLPPNAREKFYREQVP